MGDLEEAKRISSGRGEWVLEDCYYEYSELMSYVKDVAYDESLLLWHIATELCYNTDGDSHIILDCDYFNARELSKCLSDYMVYLLYQQPSLMSKVSGIAKERFMDTLAVAQRFFIQRCRPGQLRMDYQRILDVDTRFKPTHVKGNI